MNLEAIYEKISAYYPTEENLKSFKNDLTTAFMDAQRTYKPAVLSYDGECDLVVHFTGMVNVVKVIDGGAVNLRTLMGDQTLRSTQN